MSVYLVHLFILNGNERADGHSAYRALILLRRLKLLAAVEADAHVAARHYNGIGRLGHAECALLRLVLCGTFDFFYLALAGDFVGVGEAENALNLKRHPIDQYNLFNATGARDLLLGVLRKNTIVNESEILPILAVID